MWTTCKKHFSITLIAARTGPISHFIGEYKTRGPMIQKHFTVALSAFTMYYYIVLLN